METGSGAAVKRTLSHIGTVYSRTEAGSGGGAGGGFRPTGWQGFSGDQWLEP